MNSKSKFNWFCAVVGLSVAILNSSCRSDDGVPEQLRPNSGEIEMREHGQKMWNYSFSNNIKIGDSLSRLEEILKGYRDKEWVESREGGKVWLYLMDDLVQIRAVVDQDGKLVEMPLAERRGVWLKRPGGGLCFDPNESVDISLWPDDAVAKQSQGEPRQDDDSDQVSSNGSGAE